MDGAGDAPGAAQGSQLGVEGAQLDLGEHAARAQPAARDLLLAELGDERVGERLAGREAKHEVPGPLARVDGDAHEAERVAGRGPGG